MIIGGYNFSGPYDPKRGFTRQTKAVYAIIDGKSSVIDVGQTDDLNNRFPNHPRQSCWEIHAVGGFALYIFQESQEQQRLLIENAIRSRYNPLCGKK